MVVRLAVLTAAAALVGSFGATAWAAPPVELRSTTQRVSVELLSEPRPAGKNVHVEFEELLTVAEDFDGTIVAHMWCVFVGSKSLVCHGDQTFTGTIEGVDRAGTTTSKVRFTCSQTTGACTGSGTIIDADGGLAGVRGRSTFTASLVTGIAHATNRLIRP